MILKHFYLALDSDDFTDTKIVSDFNFQTDYLTHFVEKRLVKERFEVNGFNMLMIRARKKPKDDFLLEEHYKCLTIEVPFNESEYQKLYPFENKYPLAGLLQPVENEKEFCDFLIDMTIQGIEKGRKLKAPIPCDFLINTVLDFKNGGCKNEWVHKTKTFKEHGIKATLLCRLTVNYFALELIIEKNKQELFKKEILKTKPHSIQYKQEFKDIVIKDGKLVITKDMYQNPSLFELPLSAI